MQPFSLSSPATAEQIADAVAAALGDKTATNDLGVVGKLHDVPSKDF